MDSENHISEHLLSIIQFIYYKSLSWTMYFKNWKCTNTRYDNTQILATFFWLIVRNAVVNFRGENELDIKSINNYKTSESGKTWQSTFDNLAFEHMGSFLPTFFAKQKGTGAWLLVKRLSISPSLCLNLLT